MDKFYYHFFEFSFLKAGLLAKKDELILIDISHNRDEFKDLIRKKYILHIDDTGPFVTLIKELIDYLKDTGQCFSVNYTLKASPFQQKVLKRTADIPYGTVKSYGDIARAIEKPGASRAVGSALAKNNFPIIIPCHRVIKTGGHIGEFGGGRDLKRKLLAHEGITVQNNRIILESGPITNHTS